MAFIYRFWFKAPSGRIVTAQQTPQPQQQNNQNCSCVVVTAQQQPQPQQQNNKNCIRVSSYRLITFFQSIALFLLYHVVLSLWWVGIFLVVLLLRLWRLLGCDNSPRRSFEP